MRSSYPKGKRHGQKEREMPRMSAPKLGEYLDAGPSRRERILYDQKYPPNFKTARYRDAEQAIRGALLGGGDVITRLEDERRRIAALPAASKWEADAHACSSQAVGAFAALYRALPLKGAQAIHLGERPPLLVIEGVAVSAMPLVQVTRRGHAGALLGVFGKTRPLGPRGLKAVAELLYRAVAQSRADGGAGVAPELCIAVDVFGGTSAVASRRSRRISEEVSSACREIRKLWPTIGGGGAAAA